MLIGVLLWVWMAWANNKGRNWARIVASVLFGLNTISLLLSPGRASITIIFEILGWLVGLGAIVILGGILGVLRSESPSVQPVEPAGSLTCCGHAGGRELGAMNDVSAISSPGAALGSQAPVVQDPQQPRSLRNAVRLMYLGAVVALLGMIFTLAISSKIKTDVFNAVRKNKARVATRSRSCIPSPTSPS